MLSASAGSLSLDQIEGQVDLFLVDGAYDGSSTRDLFVKSFGEKLEVVIPPPKNAIFNSNMIQDPTPRNYNIAHIETNGRIAWQKAFGYNQRSRIGTQIGR